MGALVVMADCAARVYGIPRRTAARRRLMGYFVGPWIALALVGLVVGIILGLLHRHG